MFKIGDIVRYEVAVCHGAYDDEPRWNFGEDRGSSGIFKIGVVSSFIGNLAFSIKLSNGHLWTQDWCTWKPNQGDFELAEPIPEKSEIMYHFYKG